MCPVLPCLVNPFVSLRENLCNLFVSLNYLLLKLIQVDKHEIFK